MAELRKDYFTDRFTLVPSEPHLSPAEIKESLKQISKEEVCPLCPGNEEKTPPADLVLIQREGSLVKSSDSEYERITNWSIRAFPNRFPVVAKKPPPNYGESPLYREPAYGYDYILVATREHDKSFTEMSTDEWTTVLIAIQDMMKWLHDKRRVSYVSVSICSGYEAGALFQHPHVRLVTLPRLPPLIEQEAQTSKKSMDEMGECPMCRVIATEQGGPRQILSTDHFLAFVPWAPSRLFEYWIVPKRHQISLLRATQKEIGDFVLALRVTLAGLAKALDNPAFSLVFHSSPERKSTRQIHWHAEIYPYIKPLSGMEHGLGLSIAMVSPEASAEYLGTAARKEWASIMGAI